MFVLLARVFRGDIARITGGKCLGCYLEVMGGYLPRVTDGAWHGRAVRRSRRHRAADMRRVAGGDFEDD